MEKGFKGVIGVVFIVLAFLFLMMSCERVPSGYVAVQYSMKDGVQNEVLTEGIKFVSPTIKTVNYPIYEQQTEMTSTKTDKSPIDESFIIMSTDGKQIITECLVTYKVLSEETENGMKYYVPELYKKYGGKTLKEIETEIIKPRIRRYVYNVGTNLSATDLFGGKDFVKLNDDITKYCREQFKSSYIEIVQVSISCFMDEKTKQTFQQKIETQQKLERETLEKEIAKVNNEKRIAQQDADNKIALSKAETQANSIKTIAKAQADANLMLTKSITPALIEYEKVQALKTRNEKWNGVEPMVQSNATPILDLRK